MRRVGWLRLRKCVHHSPTQRTMSHAPSPGHFERQHERLDALLHAHLLDVAGADFASTTAPSAMAPGLQEHIAIENTRLLPHVPAGARWAARVPAGA
jgi:hypothetical protein